MIDVFEPATGQRAGPIGDDDPVRAGDILQAGREVGRLADRRGLVRRGVADELADDDEPVAMPIRTRGRVPLAVLAMASCRSSSATISSAAWMARAASSSWARG